ncbi:hypothetical protein HZF02_32215 (plasmid) [Pseudomonas yamanorum]|nr:hypothetical protein HZF02_32215 [Pseudomonas yamanorum]
MSDNQMISAPRALLERIETWMPEHCQDLTDLQALLAAPADVCVTPNGTACPGDGVGSCKRCPSAQPRNKRVVAQVFGYTPGMGLVELRITGGIPSWLELGEEVTVMMDSPAAQLQGEHTAVGFLERMLNGSGDDRLEAWQGEMAMLLEHIVEQPAPVAVEPEGWKLVPVHPTAEMLDAIGDGATDKSLAQNRALVAWSLILDAVPAAGMHGSWYAADDFDRHVRTLDVLINGEEGASPQAKLCDLVAQLQAKPVFGLDPAKGYALVSIKPSPGLLMSMAIRSDHGLGVPGYYDQPLMLKMNHGIPHARLLECKLSEMRQIYEEVVGTGFYSVGKEAEYAAPAVTEQGTDQIRAQYGHLVEKPDV